MADETTTILMVVLVFVMIAVTWLELRVLRKKARARRERSDRRPEELRDEAHNALITTRAIASSLAERGGIQNEEVDAMLREAQVAYDRRNYRVALDLTGRSKERLMALRAAHQAQGDVAKLETLSPGEESEEPTTKEVLQKQYPPNLVQSKFSISVAEASIESAGAAGRDVASARALLNAARSRYEAQDYGGALSLARQAEKSARGEPVTAATAPLVVAAPAAVNEPAAPNPPKPAAAPVEGACPSCGAPMKPDDAFCRKCGTRAVLTNCPTCGASLLADDAFCRKCGTRLHR